MRVRPSLAAAVLSILLLPALARPQYDPRYPQGTPPPPPPPPPAAPRGPAPQGLVLAARLGYAWPSGQISNEGDPALGALVDHQIPIWLELGYRFNPSVWGGVYIQLAPTTVTDTYCQGSGCDAFDWRFGLDLQLHLRPHGPVDPWFGIGFGVEVLDADVALDVNGDGVPDTTGKVTYTGLELPLLEGGLDFAVGPYFSVGPYLAFSLGSYTSASTEATGFSSSYLAIHDQTLHQWLQVGLKGSFKL